MTVVLHLFSYPHIVVQFFNILLVMMKSPILQVLYGNKANLGEEFLLGNDSHRNMLKKKLT